MKSRYIYGRFMTFVLLFLVLNWIRNGDGNIEDERYKKVVVLNEDILKWMAE